MAESIFSGPFARRITVSLLLCLLPACEWILPQEKEQNKFNLLLLLLSEADRAQKTACSSSLGSFLVNQTQNDSTATGQYDFLRFLSEQTRTYTFRMEHDNADNPEIYIGEEDKSLSGDPRMNQDYIISDESLTSPVTRDLIVSNGGWRCVAIYGLTCDGLCEYTLTVE